MPKLGNSETQRLYLPTTEHEANEVDRAYVDVKTTLVLADLAAVTAAEDDVARTIVLLTRLITDWNFTEDGTPETGKLPIIAENVERLSSTDFIFLSQWIGDNMAESATGLTTDEKKSSSSTQIQVTESAPTTT